MADMLRVVQCEDADSSGWEEREEREERDREVERNNNNQTGSVTLNT